MSKDFLTPAPIRQPIASSGGGVVKNWVVWFSDIWNLLKIIRFDGSIAPASLADTDAENNSIYYSTTASKLVYKDAGGVVRNLY